QTQDPPDEPLDHSRAGILPAQGNDRPAAPPGLGGERRVRVDRDGPAYAFEQRQVVVGIAVEHALGKRLKRLAEARQPLVYAPDLALAKAGRASDAPGEAAVPQLGFGGNQVAHA